MRMQILLYGIVARVVAVCVGVYTGHELWISYRKRKITFTNDGLLDWSQTILSRDSEPVKYWMVFLLELVALVACVVVAVFGWQPNV